MSIILPSSLNLRVVFVGSILKKKTQDYQINNHHDVKESYLL